MSYALISMSADWQDVEKVLQRRSRFVKILNVPSEGTPLVLTCLWPSWMSY
jgi:hypothetical protein